MRTPTLAEAVEVVRGKNLPCRECERVHEYREFGRKEPPTWADPTDGHAYQEMSWQDYFGALFEIPDRVSSH